MQNRAWVRDDFWLPADGWKLWRKDGAQPCDECLTFVGVCIEHPADNHRPAHDDCPGLVPEPIIVSVLNLQRQDGKTFSTAAFAMASMFLARNKSFELLCASEGQVKRIFAEVYGEAIKRSPALEKLAVVQRLGFDVPKMKNRFECVASSHRSITGRTRTHILIDEARDIEAAVVAALIPSIFAVGGVECPAGHVQLTHEEAESAKPDCPVCGKRLAPWHGRIIITSSSGVEQNSERDWFPELVDRLQKEPHPNFHLFQSEHALNPRKNAKVIGAIHEVMGSLDSMRHYIEAETTNRWTKKGDAFLNRSDIARVTDKFLVNEEGTANPCVAFLDTSITIEKTSLVILADDRTRSTEPWEYVYESRVDFWIPSELDGGVISEVEILNHLEAVMPMFTGLIELYVDTRGMPWAVGLVRKVRSAKYPWGNKVKRWENQEHESDAGWQVLHQRIMSGTVRLQNVKEQTDEFMGLRLQRSARGGPIKVADRSRYKSHKDITESLAMCCYFINLQKLKGSGSSMAYLHNRGGDANSRVMDAVRRARPLTSGILNERF